MKIPAVIGVICSQSSHTDSALEPEIKVTGLFPLEALSEPQFQSSPEFLGLREVLGFPWLVEASLISAFIFTGLLCVFSWPSSLFQISLSILL